MTDIDFYILSDDKAQNHEPQSHEVLMCRLAEKIHTLGHSIHINTDSTNQATQLDELLWSFKDGSFLPHQIQNNDKPDNENAYSTIVIGINEEPLTQADVLLNMAASVPLFFSRFERVTEIVSPLQQHKKSARERYGFYRDRGYKITSHNI